MSEKAAHSGGRRHAPEGSSASGRPLLSIVTVALNAAPHIERCIQSVLRQSFSDYEYLIVDGGSKDGTLDIVRRYEHRIARWISEEDRGLYHAMNKAVGLARGRWIYFLGADDGMRDCLEAVAPLLADDRTVYHGDVFLVRKGRRYGGTFGAFRLSRKNICQQAIFYPRAAFETRLFDTRYRIQADWEFNMWCLRNPRFRLRYIPLVIADFNDESGLSSREVDERFQQDYPGMLRSYFPKGIYLWRAAVYGMSRIYRSVVTRGGERTR